jgi:ribonuclease E
MSKMMLIDAAHAEETRVAVVNGTHVEEFDFESRAKKQLRGNIYLAKVTRVEPSLQAAFVDYGGNRHGFLAFNEIHPDYYQIPVADREALLREEAEENARHGGGGHHGNGGGGANGHDGEHEEAGAEDDDDLMEEEVERRRRRLMRRYKIQEVIKRRQIMLVQVVKDERGAKGASLTTYLSLAGRYCVLMPNTARGGGVSRKITSITDRKRLKDVINSLDVPDGMGLIVRTAGAKRTKAEIKRDYEYLMRLWENIRETTMKSIAPALIYEEEDLVKRAIRDMFDKDIDEVQVEGEEAYKDARDFMRMLMPSQAKKVMAYREPTPVFVKYKIEDNLSQIYSPVVPLRSGGYLVINQAEALVAIDVNSGKATRERNIEATALKTNMEAAEEAARQLRLRDLAGLIVIDFIDMDESKNNRAVEKKMKDCLKDDRARIQMGKISSFGLMELSRQRRRTGVLEGTTHSCPHCQGSGRILSVESSALAALRAVEVEAARHGAGSVNLKLPPDVALYVLNEKRGYLARLQQASGLYVAVQIDETVGHAEHEIERTSNDARIDVQLPALTPAAAPIADEDDDFQYEEDEDEEEIVDDEAEADVEARPARERDEDGEDGGRRSRGRGRRRRGRRDEQDEPRAADASAPAPVARSDDDEDEEEGEDREDADGGVAGEDADGRSRRRRRRGRRGSRRTGAEARPTEAYGWTKARTPDGADPYGWYDTAPPVDLDAEPAPANDAARQPPQAAQTPVEAPAPAAASAGDGDIWVELPAEETKPKGRGRRGRGKAAAADAAPAPVEAPVFEAPEAPVAEAAPQVAEPEALPAPPEPEAASVAKPRAKRRTKAQIAAEAAAAEAVAAAPAVEEPTAEPAPPALEVVASTPEPESAPAPREPDPAEIVAPPAQPKRGWWRRG